MKYRLAIIAALMAVAYRHGRRGSIKATAKILQEVFTYPNTSRARELHALGAKNRAAIRRRLGDRGIEPTAGDPAMPDTEPPTPTTENTLFDVLGVTAEDMEEVSRIVTAALERAPKTEE